MNGELILRFAAGALLIAANAFFVVTEFALTRTRQFAEEDFQGDRALERAWKMTERLEIHLTGCQLGISSTSVLLGVVFEPAVTSVIEPLLAWTGMAGGTLSTVSVVISVIIINLIHKIWGEQAPTYLGVERPRSVLKRTAIPMYWWTKITYPIIAFGDGLAKLTLKLFGVEITRSWTEATETRAKGRRCR